MPARAKAFTSCAPDGVTISNSLQTNGTLINDAWCRLFREHGFIIGLSLEGNEALQDYHRPDKRGRSTWSAALRGIDLLHPCNSQRT